MEKVKAQRTVAKPNYASLELNGNKFVRRIYRAHEGSLFVYIMHRKVFIDLEKRL